MMFATMPHFESHVGKQAQHRRFARVKLAFLVQRCVVRARRHLRHSSLLRAEGSATPAKINRRFKHVLGVALICLLLILCVSAMSHVTHEPADTQSHESLAGRAWKQTQRFAELVGITQSPNSAYIFGSKLNYQHVATHTNKLYHAAADVSVVTVHTVHEIRNLPKAMRNSGLQDVVRDYVVMNEHFTHVTPTFIDEFVQAMTSRARHRRHLMIYLMTSAVASFTEECLIEQTGRLAPLAQRAVDGAERGGIQNDGARQQRRVRAFVLITGCNDMPASFMFFHRMYRGKLHVVRDLLQHPLLAHWFGQNGDIVHPRFSSLPIGIDYHTQAKSGRDNDLPTQQEQSIVKSVFDAHGLRNALPAYVRIADARMASVTEEELVAGLPPATTLQWTALSQIALHASRRQEHAGLADASASNTSKTAARATGMIDVVGVVRERVSFDAPIVHRDGFGTAGLLTRVALVVSDAANGLPADKHTPVHSKKGSPLVARQGVYLTVPSVLSLGIRDNPYGHPYKRKLRVVYAFNPTVTYRHPVRDFLLSRLHDIAVDGRGSREHTWRMLREHTFVASPPGNGYDCHRVWESLAMGCIPILMYPDDYHEPSHQLFYFSNRDNISEIQASSSLDMYADLPVIFVHDYAKEVTLDSMRRWRDEVYGNYTQGKYKLEKLFSEYWISRMLSA